MITLGKIIREKIKKELNIKIKTNEDLFILVKIFHQMYEKAQEIKLRDKANFGDSLPTDIECWELYNSVELDDYGRNAVDMGVIFEEWKRTNIDVKR